MRDDLSLSEVLAMQQALQEKYRGRWEPICPETAKNKLLWMLGEAGEVIDVLKQHGGEAACSLPEVRAHLTEELADVLMYYGDILLCCGITPEEMREAFIAKHEKNMTRW